MGPEGGIWDAGGALGGCRAAGMSLSGTVAASFHVAKLWRQRGAFSNVAQSFALLGSFSESCLSGGRGKKKKRSLVNLGINYELFF